MQLFSISFSRSITKLADSRLATTEKQKTLEVLAPYDCFLSEVAAVNIPDSDVEFIILKFEINPRIAPYIESEKCARKDDIII